MAYGITDSPSGLIAWVSDMFAGFGDSPNAIDQDKFLTNVLVYWFSGTAASSIRLYYENAHDPEAWSPKPNSGVPTGVAVFFRDEVAKPLGLDFTIGPSSGQRKSRPSFPASSTRNQALGTKGGRVRGVPRSAPSRLAEQGDLARRTTVPSRP